MSISSKIIFTTLMLGIVLILSSIVAISAGSSGTHFLETISILTGNSNPDSVTATIIWQIRLPRVILAAFVGGTLALGGLVFQALLRNPLAEPYILGISGGSAIGAILAMLLGLSYFPGVAIFSFAGSLVVLAFVTILAGTTAFGLLEVAAPRGGPGLGPPGGQEVELGVTISGEVQNFVPVTDEMLRDPAPGDWPMIRRDYAATSFSPRASSGAAEALKPMRRRRARRPHDRRRRAVA